MFVYSLKYRPRYMKIWATYAIYARAERADSVGREIMRDGIAAEYRVDKEYVVE